jgi:molecular chaperone GrpE
MIEEIESKVEETIQPEEEAEQEEEEINPSEEPEVDEIEVMKLEIEDLNQKSEEFLDGWQRERAEFANYKKRMERERETLRFNITGNIIRGYLEILDDLERALNNRPMDGDGAAWAEGIELVYRKFLSTLETEGVEPMQADGQQFDPNLHEAISQEPHEELESGQIIEVVRNGYMIGERVLRPASVRVAQ